MKKKFFAIAAALVLAAIMTTVAQAAVGMFSDWLTQPVTGKSHINGGQTFGTWSPKLERPHDGEDWDAGCEIPNPGPQYALATGPGKIVWTGYLSVGYMVVIDHGVSTDGQSISTQYLHLANVYVTVGDFVEKGAALGLASCHVHYGASNKPQWWTSVTSGIWPNDLYALAAPGQTGWFDPRVLRNTEVQTPEVDNSRVVPTWKPGDVLVVVGTNPVPIFAQPQPGDPISLPKPEPTKPEVKSMVWKMPVKATITGTYYQPYSQYNAAEPHHTGMDLGAGCGSVVKSAGDGQVVLVQNGWNTFGGTTVGVFHGYYPDSGFPLVTYYNHMQASTVKVGQVIGVGEQVGEVGFSGSGCHLHYSASNIMPEEFKSYYQHSSENGGRGWVNPDPSMLPTELMVTTLAVGSNQTPAASLEPVAAKDGSVVPTDGWLAKTIRLWAELFKSYQLAKKAGFVPEWFDKAILWIISVIVLVILFAGYLQVDNWIKRRELAKFKRIQLKLKRRQRLTQRENDFLHRGKDLVDHHRHQRKFTLLLIAITVIYLTVDSGAVITLMWKITFGIKVFFYLSGRFYQKGPLGVRALSWRHWGLPEFSEVDRQLILMPLISVLLAFLIGYIIGLLLIHPLAGVTLAVDEPEPTMTTDVPPSEEREMPKPKSGEPGTICGRKGVCWSHKTPPYDMSNPTPVGDGWKPVQLKISHYVPPQGEPNCATFREGYCWSGTSSGEMWEKWINRSDIGGLACPQSIPFGTRFYLYGREWVCIDRGGAIVETGGAYWVDLLVYKAPIGYGSVVRGWMASEQPGWRLGKVK